MSLLSNYGVGGKILFAWLGESCRPVNLDVSERRAATCATCQFNSKAEGIQLLASGAASFIHEQMRAKEIIGVKIEGEEKLETCEICSCFLKLKIHVPMEIVLSRTSQKTLDEFKEKKPECWMNIER